MEKIIEIPEGYEAKIDGNKVVFVSKEERIRKRLIDCLKFSLKGAEEQDAAGCSRQKDIEAYKWGIAYLEKQKEHSMSAEEVLIKAGLKPYKDGNKWCILAGDNIQEGICGFGDTIDEALYQFLMEICDKQKEQKPADDKAFEEWIDDWWKHNRVNNPDSYDKGDEIQFDEQGFKNFCRGIRNMYQQKQVWSEEDEWVIEELCCLVDSYELEEQQPEKIKLWLKSLPERLILQPKQEWSEEDEEALNMCLDAIPKKWKTKSGILLTKWLKDNIYLQSKPKWSEEDKNYLEEIIDDLKFCKKNRRSCRNGLIENCIDWLNNRLKSLHPQPISQSSTNHTVWHNASEEKPTKLPIIHIWYHGNRVNTVVAHENIGIQEELDDINFQPDDKWAYVEDLLNVQH